LLQNGGALNKARTLVQSKLHLKDLMMNIFLRLCAASLFAHFLLACGILPPSNIVAPRLGLADLSIKSLSLSEVKFQAIVVADNPNTFALPLADTKLELILLGQNIATGTSQNSKIELAASTATEVPMEFTVSTGKLVGLLRQVGRGQWSQLSYQLKGDTKWGMLGIPLSFGRKGDFDALKKLSEILR
jgi:LEA14-like dessication related protein